METTNRIALVTLVPFAIWLTEAATAYPATPPLSQVAALGEPVSGCLRPGPRPQDGVLGDMPPAARPGTAFGSIALPDTTHPNPDRGHHPSVCLLSLDPIKPH